MINTSTNPSALTNSGILELEFKIMAIPVIQSYYIIIHIQVIYSKGFLEMLRSLSDYSFKFQVLRIFYILLQIIQMFRFFFLLGLLSISMKPDGRFIGEDFPVGTNQSVQVERMISCCTTGVDITAIDVRGNRKTCRVDQCQSN